MPPIEALDELLRSNKALHITSATGPWVLNVGKDPEGRVIIGPADNGAIDIVSIVRALTLPGTLHAVDIPAKYSQGSDRVNAFRIGNTSYEIHQQARSLPNGILYDQMTRGEYLGQAGVVARKLGL